MHKYKMGDPLNEDTDIGPMINEEEAKRAEAWIEEARQGGAKVLKGGHRDGAFLEPTVLVNTDPGMKVNCQEIFAPVLTLHSYVEFDDAVRRLDDSRYGLQAGVFTTDLGRVRYAINNIKTGGVIIGDVPTWRIDHMPYGGTKESGNTREGIKYAIREMTEEKFVAIKWY
jgi:acyl-CoA reductase-like NAD-dependent aldehyde dehydrogenase